MREIAQPRKHHDMMHFPLRKKGKVAKHFSDGHFAFMDFNKITASALICCSCGTDGTWLTSTQTIVIVVQDRIVGSQDLFQAK